MLGQFTAGQLASSIYSLGRLNHHDNNFENEWVARASTILNQFTPAQLLESINAFNLINPNGQIIESIAIIYLVITQNNNFNETDQNIIQEIRLTVSKKRKVFADDEPNPGKFSHEDEDDDGDDHYRDVMESKFKKYKATSSNTASKDPNAASNDNQAASYSNYLSVTLVNDFKANFTADIGYEKHESESDALIGVITPHIFGGVCF